jgi:glycosyltransferase involved in cell wall biosynthesis
MRKDISLWRDLTAFLGICKILRQNRYDLVHTHLAKAGILGRLGAWAAGVPHIFHSVHGSSFPDHKPFWARWAFLALERLAARCTSGFIFVGQELMSRYRRLRVGDPATYRLIYTGRDLAPFLQAAAWAPEKKAAIREGLDFNPGDIIVGLVARLVPGKGHILAIKALKELRERFPHLRLIFIGDPDPPTILELRQEMERLVAALNLGEAVTFLGHQEDIARFYAILDILIMPSEHEGLPNVLVEAAVMQLPVVASECDGVREILGDLVSVVPQGDESGFMAAMNQVIGRADQDNEERELRKEKAQEVAARWSLERMLEATKGFYDQVFKTV